MPGTTVSSRRSSRRTLRRSIHRPSRHARSPCTTLGASQSRGAHVVVLLGNCDALRVFLTVPGRSVTMSVIVDRRLLAAAAAATAVFNSPALPLSPPIYHPRVIRRRQLRNWWTTICISALMDLNKLSSPTRRTTCGAIYIWRCIITVENEYR